MSTSLIEKALLFASEKHKGHTRKNKEKSSYIVHPIAVRHILSDVGAVKDEEILAAALLHDTLEDTPTTREELIENFGERVCSLVEEVSDDKTLSKQTRKDLQIQHAPKLTEGAVLIKIADKISNVQDIIKMLPNGWDVNRCLEYLNWAEEVILNCPKVNEALETHFAVVIEIGREIIKK